MRAAKAVDLLENWEDTFQELTLSLPEKLAMLPAGAADILRNREQVPSDSYDASADCLGMNTAEARLLDAALSEAEFEQDEWRNRYLLEYHYGLHELRLSPGLQARPMDDVRGEAP